MRSTGKISDNSSKCQRMITWLGNYLQFNKDHSCGTCPHCGSENIAVDVYTGNRKVITFTCKDCNSSQSFDGRNIRFAGFYGNDKNHRRATR